MSSFLKAFGYFLSLTVRTVVITIVLIQCLVSFMDATLSWDMVPLLGAVAVGLLLDDSSDKLLQGLWRKNLPAIKKAIADIPDPE